MAYNVQEIQSQKEWDSFVLAHSPMALFQSWEWGEVEKKLGNSVWRWGWCTGKCLTGVAQIEKIAARRGTFLHVRHGAIGKINYDDLKKLAKKEGAWFIRVSPRLPPHEEKQYKKLGFVPAPIHAMDAELCWVLDLDKSEEELLADMRKTTRYEIRRAKKMGVKVEKSTDTKRFFDLYNKTSERHNFVQHTGIREEIGSLDAEVLLAIHEAKAVAAAIIVYFGDEAIYHHGASIPNKVGASYLLQWEAIREAKIRGLKLYNFWGIAPEDKMNHPWRGITLFKTGFGGRQMEFMHAQDYPVSPLYVIPKTIEQIRKKIKGY
jgi:peptidoglycan pentaglycine glycine transferase (the first glycine)